MNSQKDPTTTEPSLAPITSAQVIQEVKDEVRILSEGKDLSSQQGENIRANAWDSYEYFNS